MYYRLEHEYGKARAHNNLGLNYEAKTEFDSALSHYHRALKISKSIPSGEYTAYSLSNIGNFHIKEGNLEKAFQNKTQSLNYYKKYDIKNGIAE